MDACAHRTSDRRRYEIAFLLDLHSPSLPVIGARLSDAFVYRNTILIDALLCALMTDASGKRAGVPDPKSKPSLCRTRLALRMHAWIHRLRSPRDFILPTDTRKQQCRSISTVNQMHSRTAVIVVFRVSRHNINCLSSSHKFFSYKLFLRIPKFVNGS